LPQQPGANLNKSEPSWTAATVATIATLQTIWMGGMISSNTSKEIGIPRGMAYLTGFVVQAAIDDEIFS
jgi:hypothetical protein